jgi:hypothetical protein
MLNASLNAQRFLAREGQDRFIMAFCLASAVAAMRPRVPEPRLVALWQEA